MKTKLYTSFAIACIALLLAIPLLRQPEDNAATSLEIAAEEVTPKLLSGKSELLALASTNIDTTSPEILELARERGELMAELVQSDPEAALSLAFSFAEYERLPAPVKALVEKPFTETLSFQRVAVCFDESAAHEDFLSLRFPDGERLEITRFARSALSKNALPAQGIRIGNHAAVRPTLFQSVSAEELQWAREHLPQIAFEGPAEQSEQPVYAISGGRLFQFPNSELLHEMEESLLALDNKPGYQTSSGTSLAKLKSGTSVSADAFLSQLAEPQTFSTTTDETRDVLVIRVAFSDQTESPFSKEEIENLLNGIVAPALAENSFGKSSIQALATSNVFPLGSSSSYTHQQDIYDDAITAYMGGGNPDPENAYQHVVVSFPERPFGWAGLASIGGPAQWLNAKVSADVILHEFGHNYGLSHASYWQHDTGNASSTNPVDPSGSSEEYGDIYDIMGDGTLAKGHFHAAAKNYLGWIANNQIAQADSSADNGTYRIYALDDVSTSSIQGLRIAKPATSDYYWLGYRQLFSGVETLRRGIYLTWENHAESDMSNQRTWLIDATPSSEDGKADAGLALGSTFSDTASQVHITPLATGQDPNGQYIEVAINYGPFTGNQNPSGTLTAPATAEARSATSFSFAGSDPDGDTLAYHWDFGDGTVELNSASVEHSFPVGGTYTLTLTVSDLKGGTYQEQSVIEVSDPISTVSTRVSPTDQDLNALASNGDLVVAGGGQGAFIRSLDGQSWTLHSVSGGLNATVFDIDWSGTHFIACGLDYDFSAAQWEGVIYHSTDGTDWEQLHRSVDAVDNWGFTSLAVNPASQSIVAVRNDALLEVRDAEGVWQTVDLGLDSTAWQGTTSLVSVEWSGSAFILGGYNQTEPDLNKRLVLFRSDDGISWTDLSADSGILSWKGLSEIAYLNGNLLGSGFKTRMAYSSDDGETWRANGQGDIYRAYAYAYGNGIYSAHGIIDHPAAEGEFENSGEDVAQDFLSVDGRNWKPAGAPLADYNDRVFFNDTFISVGDAGLIHQSQSFDAPTASPYELWIASFIADEQSWGANLNPDLDWAANFIEYALGSDPLDASSVPPAPTIRIDSEGRATVSIYRYAKTDAIITLESSTDLETWTSLASESLTDNETLLELRSAASLENPNKVFIRLRISL